MLNLVFAPPSAGVVEHILSSLKGTASPKPAILLVPRHFSHECERLLCEVCGDAASLVAEVLTMSRLANRVFSDLGGIADTYLDDAGRLLVLRRALSKVETRLTTISRFVRQPEYLREFVRFIDEIKSCKVDITSLEMAALSVDGELGKRLQDIALLYAAYEAELGRLSDPRDMYSRLAAAMDNGWAVGRDVKVIGFTEFTAQEYDILRLFIRDCNSVTVEFSGIRSPNARFSDDPFYSQLRSAESLKRIAAQVGSQVSEETLPSNCAAKSPELLHLERNLFAHPSLRYDGECKAVILYTECSVWNECERTAAEILRSVKEGLRFNEIAVALPSGGDYRGTIQAVFEAWKIPFFLDSVDAIATKNVIHSLISVVDIIVNRFASPDLLTFLKSGLAPIDFSAACRLENYIYTWNLRGHHWTTDRDWSMNPNGFSSTIDGSRQLEQLNGSRRALSSPFLRFISAVTPGVEYAVGDMLREFYRLLEELRFDKNIARRGAQFEARGDLKTAGEHAQLWDIVCNLLDECHNILSETTMTFAEFSAYLKLLLANSTVGTIPVALDGVPVGDAGRLRHRHVKCLFILGASAGSFPPPAATGALLSDHDRARLSELAIDILPSGGRLDYRTAESAYAAVTLPSQRLTISWVSTGGAPTSYLVQRIVAMLGISPTGTLGEERLLLSERPALELALRAAAGNTSGLYPRAALSYFEQQLAFAATIEAARKATVGGKDNLSEQVVINLYGETITLTASRIDHFHGCPFSFFMRYGLRTKSRTRAALDALEGGNLIHYVLEQTIREASQSGLLDGEIGESQKLAARGIAAGYIRQYAERELGGLEDKGARTLHLFDMLSRAANGVVDDIMDEFAASDFRPRDFELSFGMQPEQLPAVYINQHARLIGKVDRVDTWQGDKLYLRVVDYKSGQTGFDLSDVYHGSKIQLLIYLFALEKNGASRYGASPSGAGVLYLPSRDVILNSERGTSDTAAAVARDKRLRRSGLLLDDPTVIEAMEHGNDKRFLPISVNKDGSFSATSWVASRQRFDLLGRHVEGILNRAAGEILSGKIDAQPAYSHGGEYCKRCDYRAACRHDDSNGTDVVRYIPTVARKDFWEKLEEDLL